MSKNDNCHFAVSTKVAVKVMGRNAWRGKLLLLLPPCWKWHWFTMLYLYNISGSTAITLYAAYEWLRLKLYDDDDDDDDDGQSFSNVSVHQAL